MLTSDYLTKSFFWQNLLDADGIPFIEWAALHNMYLKQFGVCRLHFFTSKSEYLYPKEAQLVFNIHSSEKKVPNKWSKWLR